MSTLTAWALLAGLLLGAGCKKTEPKSSFDTISDTFTAAGLKVSDFKPADGAAYSAYRCQSGRIETLDALVCEYGDPAAAGINKNKAEAWIGNATTGIAVVRGALVLVLVDRSRSDLNGKMITRVARTFAPR